MGKRNSKQRDIKKCQEQQSGNYMRRETPAVSGLKDVTLGQSNRFPVEQLGPRVSQKQENLTVEDIMKRMEKEIYLQDFVSRTDIFTTAREKYLLKLGLENEGLPAEVVRHALKDYCFKPFHTLGENYVCCYGFILKKSDVSFSFHNFETCNDFHQLNADLVCYHGKIYYPIDLLLDAVENWKERPRANATIASKVHDLIIKTWPLQQLFGRDLNLSHFTSFEERYLIHLMSNGLIVPDKTIAHVVQGCKIKPHMIDENHGCCYGFILTRSEFYSHELAMKDPERQKDAHIGRVIGPDGKPVRNPENLDFIECAVNHPLNDKLSCSHGVVFYSLAQCKSPCSRLRSRRDIEINAPFTSIKGVQEVYRRIKYKKKGTKTCYTLFTDLRPWEEYLIKLIIKGIEIPVHVISHVIDGLDGCFVGAHLLDDKFGCCCGYILTRQEFMSHDFRTCASDHPLNEELGCKNGKVYHILAPKEWPSTGGLMHVGGQPARKGKILDIGSLGDAPVPYPPPAPAPPPPDLLDQ